MKQEYTPPTKSRCEAQSKKIESDIATFLNNGGAITTIETELEVTDANIRTKAKRDSARKRGLKTIRKSQGVAA